MKLVVLIKQVPVVSAMRFDAGTRRLVREGVPTEVSAFDVRAVVKALELRQAPGDEVVVMTMGPPDARAALLHCLALGADRAIHLVDRAFAGADTLATARVLAAALRHEGFDLVLCGRQSADAETGQVGPEVAELLDVAQVTGAHRLTIDRDARRVIAEREIDDGYESVDAPLPALVTAAEDLAPERFPTKVGREDAKAKPIAEVGAADLGLAPAEVGAAGSPTRVDGLEIVDSARAGRIIEAPSPVEAVERLVEELVARRLLDPGQAAAALLPPAPDAPRPLRGPAYWVVAAACGSGVGRASVELLAKASELAEQGGGHTAAVLLGGPGVAAHVDEVAAHGADVAYVAESPLLAPYVTEPYTALLATAIGRHRPAAVLVPATALGRDLAPRVAARLGLGLTGDCIDLGLADDGRVVQYKPAFGGNVVAPIRSRTAPDFATVRPGMLSARAPNRARRISSVRWTTDDLRPSRVTVRGRTGADASDAARLDSTGTVIGVGKGIGAAENLRIVRRLAAALDAPLAATRDVTDLGWLPRQHQVGLTGRAIAPRLYVAVAIRGAPEHVVGVRRAGFVVAINTSAKAPIFKHADVGIVADYAEVIPALVAAIERRRAAGALTES
jgi:electron transfer flavoprotein alpha subunit